MTITNWADWVVFVAVILWFFIWHLSLRIDAIDRRTGGMR